MNRTLLSNQNHLYDLARKDGLRLPGGLSPQLRVWIDRLYPLLAIFFSLVTPLMGSIFSLGPLVILMMIDRSRRFGPVSADLQLLAELVSGFLPIYVIVWLWGWLLEKRQLWTAGLEKGGALRKYLAGALFGTIIFSAAVGFLAVSGSLEISSQPGQLSLAGWAGVLLVLLGWIIQGSAEELLARGYLLPVIGSRYGTLIGVLLSSLVFTSWHLFNPNISFLAIINLALYGVLAAFYALYEGGIWGVCAFHTFWNWVQGNIFGFEVSGGSFGGSVLFKFHTAGPDWLTGGKFGPEGSLAVTLVLVFGCLWLLIASLRKGATQAKGPGQGEA